MKKKYFVLLVCLMLCSFLSSTTKAQNPTPFNISSQGSINYSSPNLASIPDDWEMYKLLGRLEHGTGPQIIFVDASIERTPGKPSIRIEPHTAADLNTARECNGIWYPCKPGDHIVAKVWIKTDPSTAIENADPYHGGRLGIEWDGHDSTGKFYILDGHPTGAEHIASMVMFNTPQWTLRTWDIIIPSTIYTQDSIGQTIPGGAQADTFVLWLQGMQLNDGTATGNIWFADAELYINP